MDPAPTKRHDGRVTTAYRDYHGLHRGPALCSLTERDVIDFARREAATTVGPECKARFFRAGGAYKTLLTGRPPRDLDLWAPSRTDREVLVATLLDRGGRRLEERPYSDAFEIGGRIVEVPHKTEPDTLEARLARFDIGLSAVGVEHRPGDQWRAVINPLARSSVERRQVLLLKPLANWKHCLATLSRMRRYAAELGYSVPAEEVAEVWRVFDSHPEAEHERMLQRFRRSAHFCPGVREEAVCRLR